MEIALLFAQLIGTGGIAAWLATGVRDNILHPDVNRVYTSEVMQMTRMKAEYPEVFATLANRAVDDPKLHHLAFKLVVIAEAVATLILALGTLCLALAMIGAVEASTARAIALTGTALFTGVWSGFLIVGNHFSYWFCHEGAQNTHYQMTLWGVGLMILLAQG